MTYCFSPHVGVIAVCFIQSSFSSMLNLLKTQTYGVWYVGKEMDSCGTMTISVFGMQNLTSTA
jgi:hypothetical protein